MGITIRPSGEAAASAQAGSIIGKGERAKEDRARGEREEARAQQIAAQQQARQMAQEWDVQKMLLNSQQDQAHEMRMRQADLDGEARAKEWEVEKMELHSKFDFEQDEKERMLENATFDAGIKTIQEDNNHNDDWKERASFLHALKHPDAKNAPQYLGHQSKSTGLFDFGKEETPPPSLDKNGTPNSTVDNPLGLSINNIPTNQLPQAVLDLETQNKFEVISPDGASETIDAAEWPVKKAQGYILSQIRKLKTEKVHKPYVTSTLGEYGGF